MAAPGQMLAANGLVYFGGDDGNVYAYRQSSASRPEWVYRARTGTLGAPIADAKHVYVSLLNNSARALDARNGSMRWAVELPARPTLGMALGPDKLVVPLLSGELAVCTFRPGGLRPSHQRHRLSQAAGRSARLLSAARVVGDQAGSVEGVPGDGVISG